MSSHLLGVSPASVHDILRTAKKHETQGLLGPSLPGYTMSFLPHSLGQSQENALTNDKASQNPRERQIDSMIRWKEQQRHVSRRHNSLGPILLYLLPQVTRMGELAVPCRSIAE